MEKLDFYSTPVPCRRCGKIHPLGTMSQKLICATCVGIATIMAGKSSAETKKRMKKEVAENAES